MISDCLTLAREIEVATKTIQWDIDYMRDSLGLPVEWDGSENGTFAESTTSGMSSGTTSCAMPSGPSSSFA